MDEHVLERRKRGFAGDVSTVVGIQPHPGLLSADESLQLPSARRDDGIV